MMAGPVGTRAARGPLGGTAGPLGLFLVAFGSAQLYFWAAPSLPVGVSQLASFGPPLVAIAAFFAGCRWEGRAPSEHGLRWPSRPWAAAGGAGLLVLVYAIALLEPGLGLGFERAASPTLASLGYELALAPLTAVAGELVYRGYLLERWLVPGRLGPAVGVSAALFALSGTNLPAVATLSGATLVRFLLTYPASQLVLGVVLGLYYFRTGRNLFGPVLLRLGLLAFAFLSPVFARSTGWELTFLLNLFALGLVVALATVLTPQSRLVARRYLGESLGPRRGRFLARRRNRQRWGSTIASSAVAVVVAVVGLSLLVSALGTSRPLLAVESGSMAPTLHRGDLVVLERDGVDEISVGTVIAYDSPCLPSPVVHRVVSVSEGPTGPLFTTKGDANPGADPCAVGYGAVLGRVVATVPYVGIFVLAPTLAVGAVALAVLVSVLAAPVSRTRLRPRRFRR